MAGKIIRLVAAKFDAASIWEKRAFPQLEKRIVVKWRQSRTHYFLLAWKEPNLSGYSGFFIWFHLGLSAATRSTRNYSIYLNFRAKIGFEDVIDYFIKILRYAMSLNFCAKMLTLMPIFGAKIQIILSDKWI